MGGQARCSLALSPKAIRSLLLRSEPSLRILCGMCHSRGVSCLLLFFSISEFVTACRNHSIFSGGPCTIPLILRFWTIVPARRFAAPASQTVLYLQNLQVSL